MTSLILDLLVAAVILLFALLGWQKGLVLTLCGLLAVFLAYAGATFVSNTFCDDIAGIFQPSIQNHLDLIVENALPSYGDDVQSTPLPLPGTPQTDDHDLVTASLGQVVDILQRSPVLSGMYESVAEAVKDGAIQVVTTATAAIANYLAHQISRAGLFFLTFFLIVIAWSLFSRALDLACRLPVLRTFNEIGGLMIGVAKGGLILLAVIGLLTLLGIMPEEITQGTYLYRHFMNFQLP